MNVIRAVEAEKQLGVFTISFLGRAGGKVAGISDVELIVPNAQATGRIQEAHEVLYHTLCGLVDLELGHV